MQPEEVVADVLAAAEMGITVVHLHARDEHDEPSHRKEIYARMIGAIRERRPDLVICVSCSGRTASRIEDRADVLDLSGDARPDMASLTLSSLNFPRQASVNAPDVVRGLAERMLAARITPELEVFDLGMVNVIRYLRERGLVGTPCYANLLFGNLATAQADLLEIGAVVARLPEQVVWSLAGIGAAQLPMAAVAVAMADGVRIGLEDNLYLDPERRTLASNIDLVTRVHRLATAVGRSVMTPQEFRQRLGLAPGSPRTKRPTETVDPSAVQVPQQAD